MRAEAERGGRLRGARRTTVPPPGANEIALPAEDSNVERPRPASPGRLSLVYVAVAGAWILGSDLFLRSVGPDIDGWVRDEVLKGLAFVLVTGALLYGLLRRRDRLLRSAEEESRRLERAVEQSGSTVVMTDSDGNIVYVNPRFTETAGYEPEEVLGQNPRLLKSGEEEPGTYQRMWTTITRGETWRGEFHNRRKDGSLYWETATISAIRDEEGTITHYLAVKEDVTEQKRSEQRRQRLKEILEASPNLVVMARTDGRLEYVNPAGRAILGLEPTAEAEGRSLRTFFDDADARRIQSEALPQAMRAGTWTGDLTVRATGGAPRQVRTTVIVHRDESGEARFLSAVGRDVTRERQLSAQLQQAQKMEAIARLAGGVAHDFSNLLTVIRGYLDLLLGKESATERERHQLLQMASAADRAAGLTRRLLLFARQQPAGRQPVDVCASLQELEQLFTTLVGGSVRIETRVDDPCPPVLVDPIHLEQIVMNLVVNARDAMPDGGRLRISTEPVRLDEEARASWLAGPAPGPYVVVSVEDTGEGMDEAVVERIFEPFFTTKGPDRGTGLGLATVYALVEQTGGGVRVRSRPGAGATFEIALPVATSAREGGEQQPVATSLPRGTEGVLVVEDETDVRDLVASVLTGLGYRVFTAATPAEALDCHAARTGEIALLLTDLVLPQMSGTRIAEALRGRDPRLGVVFMSGHPDPAAFGVRPEGGEDYTFLAKPLTLSALAVEVRHMLDRRAGARS